MDRPVTDVQFVCDIKNCPEGYTLISQCPCGHEAQLWEKVLGGKDGERYLCYTKEDLDGHVIEHMYIPKRFDQYLKKGYEIVQKTVEGKESMRHRQLAVRKVPRDKATKVVADIIICRGSDTPSKLYKKLEKINGVCICFRQADYKVPERRNSDPVTSLSKLGPGGDRLRSNTVAPKRLKQQLDDLRLSSSNSASPSAPPLSPERNLPSSGPAHSTQGPYEPAAMVRVSSDLGSAPPLLPPSTKTTYPSTTPPPSSSPYPPLSATPPPSSSPYPPPSTTPPPSSSPYPRPMTTPPPSSSPYPPAAPPSGSSSYTRSLPHNTPSSTPGYPSYQPRGYYPSNRPAAPYPPSQPTYGYPPQQPPGYGAGVGFGVGPPGPGAARGGGQGGMGGYPYAAPMGYPGYSSVAGASFMGATFAPKPSGPAPYNPFQQGTAPPYPPPRPAGHAPYPPAPHAQPSGHQNYGFNF